MDVVLGIPVDKFVHMDNGRLMDRELLVLPISDQKHAPSSFSIVSTLVCV